MCLLAGSLAGSAQQMVPLSYRNYMEKVAEGNLEYAAERLNMNVSEAEVVASTRTCPSLISTTRTEVCKWEKEWRLN